MILDGGLKFNLHVANINNKVNVLRRIRPDINEHVALQIYKIKIQPYIDYGDIFYMSANADKLEVLQKLQYRALRVCLNAARLTPRIKSLSRGHLPMLNYRRIVHLRNYMFKIKNWKLSR